MYAISVYWTCCDVRDLVVRGLRSKFSPCVDKPCSLMTALHVRQLLQAPLRVALLVGKQRLPVAFRYSQATSNTKYVQGVGDFLVFASEHAAIWNSKHCQGQTSLHNQKVPWPTRESIQHTKLFLMLSST